MHMEPHWIIKKTHFLLYVSREHWHTVLFVIFVGRFRIEVSRVQFNRQCIEQFILLNWFAAAASSYYSRFPMRRLLVPALLFIVVIYFALFMNFQWVHTQWGTFIYIYNSRRESHSTNTTRIYTKNNNDNNNNNKDWVESSEKTLRVFAIILRACTLVCVCVSLGLLLLINNSNNYTVAINRMRRGYTQCWWRQRWLHVRRLFDICIFFLLLLESKQTNSNKFID